MLDLDRRHHLRQGLIFARVMLGMSVFAFILDVPWVMGAALGLNAAIWLGWSVVNGRVLNQLELAAKDDRRRDD